MFLIDGFYADRAHDKSCYEKIYKDIGALFRTPLGVLFQALIRSLVMVLILVLLLFPIKPKRAYIQADLLLLVETENKYELTKHVVRGKAEELEFYTNIKTSDIFYCFDINST